MKNRMIQPMLIAINELMEFKPKNIAFVSAIIKAKRQLVSAFDEVNEIIKVGIQLTEAELELSKKLGTGYIPVEDDEAVLATLTEKDKKYAELMNGELLIEFAQVSMDDFPSEAKIKHFDILEPIIKAS